MKNVTAGAENKQLGNEPMAESQLVFCRNLSRLREEKNLKPPALAHISGIAVSTIRLYEKGTRWPQPDKLDLLAKALKCQLSDFFDPSPSSDRIEVSREDWERRELLVSALQAVSRITPPSTKPDSVNSIYPCDSSFTANEHKLGSIHQYSAVSTSALSEGIDGPDIYFLGN